MWNLEKTSCIESFEVSLHNLLPVLLGEQRKERINWVFVTDS